MNAYKNLHLWLMIPCAIALLGFAPSYWLRFTDVPWRHHLHGLTASLWFALLILQPYLVTRGHPRQHRLLGMIALVLAGGVAISGLGVIPYILVNERLPTVARYGLSFIDLVLVGGFVLAVVMGVASARRVHDHARWMISTAFWAVPPGLFRLLLFPLAAAGVGDLGTLAPYLLAATGLANILVLALLMLRDRRAHPAYLCALVGSSPMLLLDVFGNAPWWRAVAETVFTL